MTPSGSVGHALGLFHRGCRRVRGLWALAFFFLAASGVVDAQISPGKLIAGHSNLEGLAHCTSCHTVGKALSNDKCLTCHTEIRDPMMRHHGYHATIGTKMCSECHHDHQGEDFQIVRFDTSSFNHSSVGFTLTGGHKLIGCRSCHTPAHTGETVVAKFSASRRSHTWLGLTTTCSPCHADAHRGQFTATCETCHSTGHWKPADHFNHDKTRYPLTGRHRTVDCYGCHTQKFGDGKTVKFTAAPFPACASCHADPHHGRFRQTCETCHTTDDFRQIKGKAFHHDETRFPLLGKHASVTCNQCHQKNPKLRNAAGELGFHITRFQRCSDCHADAHAGQMAGRPDGGKCESCHNVAGFIPAQFTISDHAATRYPLTGAHVAVACVDCHKAGRVKAQSTRQFIWQGQLQCLTCHQDVHQGQFAGKMPKGCETCHQTIAWSKLLFSHDSTRFPLRGKHAEIACSDCHKPPKVASVAVRYAGLTMVCADCHKDEHEGQFAVDGATECARCHTAFAWARLVFDHDTQSRFHLTGKHKDVACEKCHGRIEVNGRSIVKYKPLGVECVDCHGAKT